MNKLYTIFIACMLPLLSMGQKKGKEHYIFQEVAALVLDGDLTEWNLYNNDSQVWSFGLSCQGNILYAAVRIKDEALQMEALRSGIFVNISYNDKKKDGAKLYFPFVDREKRRALLQEDGERERDLKNDMLNSVRGYYIEGFSKIINGLLSLDNHYDVKAVVKLDEQQGLLYEAQIPLDLIKFNSNKIAVQLGVNTNYLQMQQMQKQAQRPNHGAMMYGRGPVTKRLGNPYNEETAVWIEGNIN